MKRWLRILGKDFRRRLYRATFALEVLGVLIVGCYTLQAWKQSRLLTQSVNEQVLSNGPLIYPHGVEATGWTADKIPVPNKVHIIFHNYGKSLALTVVTIGQIMMGDAKSPPRDPSCDEFAVSVPKSDFIDAMEPDPTKSLEKDWFPAKGEDSSEANNGRSLYVVGCVYYFGIDRIHRYFTDVCVHWDRAKPQDFQTCNDPARSFAH